MQTFIGIDVSKDTLDFYNESSKCFSQSPNTVSGIKKSLKEYNPAKHILVVEPTGAYSDKLLHIGSELNFEIKIVSPSQSHAFMSALGIVHKNDKNAAHSLVRMAHGLDLPTYREKEENMKHRQQIQMAFNALNKQKQQLKNQLHALAQYYRVVPQAKQALETSLQTVEAQLEQLQAELQSLDDEEAKQFKTYATSVVGIGEKSANLLSFYTDGLSLFKEVKSLLSFVGVVPYSHSSGTSVLKKGRMTKKGASQLRSCLYNAAKSAKRFNNACKAIYTRLRKKGKPHKVAMIAVIKKLLQQVFAVVKSNTKFDNELYLKITEKKIPQIS